MGTGFIGGQRDGRASAEESSGGGGGSSSSVVVDSRSKLGSLGGGGGGRDSSMTEDVIRLFSKLALMGSAAEWTSAVTCRLVTVCCLPPEELDDEQSLSKLPLLP